MLIVFLAAALTQQAAPPLPDSARTDPYGYERAECSPLIRPSSETLEQCQSRVRLVLAAHLGDALPDGLKTATALDDCRQAANGDRYAMQCGTPSRPDRPVNQLVEQTCETRPQARSGGGVEWREQCRPTTGEPAREGIGFRIGGRD